MFDRIKKFFNGTSSYEGLEEELVTNPIPPQLFETIVLGPGFTHVYSDLTDYEYFIVKDGALKIDLTLLNSKYKKHLLYAPKQWWSVTNNAQLIKNPDIDQIKTAWESPTEGFPSLDDK